VEFCDPRFSVDPAPDSRLSISFSFPFQGSQPARDPTSVCSEWGNTSMLFQKWAELRINRCTEDAIPSLCYWVQLEPEGWMGFNFLFSAQFCSFSSVPKLSGLFHCSHLLKTGEHKSRGSAFDRTGNPASLFGRCRLYRS